MNPKHNETDVAAEWRELADSLNSIVSAPSRAPEVWKQRLQEWRYTLNMKHRLLVVDANATGGGQPTAKPLKDFEQRALSVFSPVVTTGNPRVLTEAGIDEQFCIPEQCIVNALVDHSVYDVIETESANNVAVDEEGETVPSTHRTVNPTKKSKRVRSQKAAENDNLERVLERLEKLENQRATEAREERIENRQMILQVANSFSESMNALAQAILSSRRSSDL